MDENKPATEQMRPEDSNFIPELEYDENGKVKKRPYQQKPYEGLSEYGG
jgi:hypothetical protein